MLQIAIIVHRKEVKLIPHMIASFDLERAAAPAQGAAAHVDL